MSITLSSHMYGDLLSLGGANTETFKLLTFQNAPEAFAILGNYIHPLEGTKVSSNNQHYRTMSDVINYFTQAGKHKGLIPSPDEISNWAALNLMTSLWNSFRIAVPGDSDSSSQDLTQRVKIEDAFLRVLNNYGVVQNSFFKGQEHFSVTQGDPRKLSRSLGQAINEGRSSKSRADYLSVVLK